MNALINKVDFSTLTSDLNTRMVIRSPVRNAVRLHTRQQIDFVLDRDYLSPTTREVWSRVSARGEESTNK